MFLIAVSLRVNAKDTREKTDISKSSHKAAESGEWSGVLRCEDLKQTPGDAE